METVVFDMGFENSNKNNINKRNPHCEVIKIMLISIYFAEVPCEHKNKLHGGSQCIKTSTFAQLSKTCQ